MSARDEERKRCARALAEATREAREDPEAGEADARVDWSRVDRELFARLDAEAPQTRSREADRRRSAFAWTVGGLAAAATAVLAVLAGGEPRDVGASNVPGLVQPPSASRALRALGGGALDLRVNGRIVGADFVLHAGDTLETVGVGATFSARGALTWAMDSSTYLRVERGGDPLVLTLDRGSVEAEVSPVRVGEAFAIDVGGVRVAVHGTHLRVENRGGRLVLDLQAGVVVVGHAPRLGMTTGTLVAAPAHVELDSSDLEGTLVIRREPTAVRAALALPLELESGPAQVAAPALPAPAPAASATSLPASPLVRPPAKRVGAPPDLATPVVASAAPSPPPRVASPTSLDALARPATSGATTPPAPRTPVPPPRAPVTGPGARPIDGGIPSAVRSCWFEHSAGAGPTTTTLTVDVGDDGGVRDSSFDPPVPAAVAACAKRAIGSTRFPAGGRVTLTIDFSR